MVVWVSSRKWTNQSHTEHLGVHHGTNIDVNIECDFMLGQYDFLGWVGGGGA